MIMPHWPLYLGRICDIGNGNERVLKILSFFNDPQNSLKNVIHITGTNGKGSTVTTISQILISSGYKVGTYISPHIHEVNERILVNNQQIHDTDLFNIIEEIRYICEKNNIMPTIFQTTTVAMILHFSRQNNDFNVIEIGMGGLHDATNVFETNPPIASVITPIHIDHSEFLGNTINEIAFQKSFIIKQNSICVSANQIRDANLVLKARCDSVNSKIYLCGRDFDVAKIENDDRHFAVEFCNPDFKIEEIILPIPQLRGDHQLYNCALSVATMVLVKNAIERPVNL